MRVLVTGGAGYIGSHVVKALRAAGHEVAVLDNLSRGHRQAVAGVPLFQADLLDRPALDWLFANHPVEAVLHFAALSQVGESQKLPGKYALNNVAGTVTLLEAMVAAGCRTLVFSSTAAVYGAPETMPITEDYPLEPTNTYGETKLFVERMLRRFDEAYGLRSIALRYFNAAGADPEGELGEDHDPETHLIPLTLAAALGQRPAIEVFGTDYPTSDGTCVRDYIHVTDLAEAHLLALVALAGGAPTTAYNLGNGRGFSVREVIAAAERVTGRSIPVREGPRRPGDPPALVASSARAEAELGWRPRYGELETIIQTAWEWHRTHPQGYGKDGPR
ncbi:MAG TPA: UDP-glucose 4-epimerase GalE [Firmicutes bacterium]|nr:UDP-glucose 4-epimerase GalE [Bacillota bacterium]